MAAPYICSRCTNTMISHRSIRMFSHRNPRLLSQSACNQLTRTISIQSGGKRKATRAAVLPQEKRSSSSSQGGQKLVGDEPFESRVPGGLASTPIPQTTGTPLLLPNNLFHPFSKSPSPEIRQRAAFIKQQAYCPHSSHRQTRLPAKPSESEISKAQETPSLPPAHVKFECPDCGIPIACSEEHWAEDYEVHLEICETLREINEDDHDLRSGRFFPEFEYPGPQMEEALINMTNWDTFLYSREFRAINKQRALRQATRLLTYPVTIGSILHELSPYNIRSGGRLTPEGLKSLSGEFS
jgi:splicing suppressor protein 51